MIEKKMFPCKDCRFHVPLSDPRQYTCHVNPPIPLLMPDQQHGMVIRTVWPTVGMHDSCGSGLPTLKEIPSVMEFKGAAGPTEPIDNSRKN